MIDRSLAWPQGTSTRVSCIGRSEQRCTVILATQLRRPGTARDVDVGWSSWEGQTKAPHPKPASLASILGAHVRAIPAPRSLPSPRLAARRSTSPDPDALDRHIVCFRALPIPLRALGNDDAISLAARCPGSMPSLLLLHSRLVGPPRELGRALLVLLAHALVSCSSASWCSSSSPSPSPAAGPSRAASTRGGGPSLLPVFVQKRP